MKANEVSKALAERAQAVVEKLLPQGKKRGREWKVGSVQGEPGDSLSVCLAGAKVGLWSDFSTGQKGDLLDLWMEVGGHVSMSEVLKEARAFLGVRAEMPAGEPKPRQYQRPERPQCRKAEGRVLSWLMGRGLSAMTVEAFRVGEQERNGRVYAVFPYLRGGELINTKLRNIEDKKDMRQAAGAEPCLFGWHLIDPKARSVAICEGELDAMTLHQMGIPALSVNAGAGNHQWIETDWQRLEAFSEIWLCWDDDDAGRKGVAEVAQRLGIERCRVVTFPGANDANEYLTSAAKPDSDDFQAALRAGRTFDPDELRQFADFWDEVTASFWPAPGEEPDYPPLKLAGTVYDWWHWRPGEVSVWTGFNGHGKSMMLMQALIDPMVRGQRICVFSGEMPALVQGRRLAKQITGLDRASPEYMAHVRDWLRGRAWLFNVLGVAKLDRLLEVFRYASGRYGVQHFVIDSLMTLDVPEDGPGALTAQRLAMRKVVSFAQETQTHVHLVAHPRKGQNEESAPGKMDVGGSGHITNAADNVWSVWSARNEEGTKPDEPDAKLTLVKDRDGEAGKREVRLYFNREARQYSARADRRGYQYLPFSTQEEIPR